MRAALVKCDYVRGLQTDGPSSVIGEGFRTSAPWAALVNGTAESTARESQRASMWNSEAAIDNARQLAERNSFRDFVGKFETLWQATLAEHVKVEAPRPLTPPAPSPVPEPTVKPPVPPALEPQPGTYTF